MRTAQELKRLLEAGGSQRAVQYRGQWYSWHHLGGVAGALEVQLAQAGVDVGTTVGLVLRHRPSCIGTFYALLATGRPVALISPALPDRAMSEEISGLCLAAVVADAEDWARDGFLEAVNTTGTVGLQLREPVPFGISRVDSSHGRRDGPYFALPSGAVATLLTSGTTGPAKRIPVAAGLVDRIFAGVRPARGGVTINALPLVSVGGFFALIESAMRGRPIAVMERFDVREWAELVREHHPRRIGAPPAVLRMILDARIPVGWFDGVELYQTASAPLDPALAEAFTEAYGIPVLQTYGATEFRGAVTGWTEADRAQFGVSKRASVGRARSGIEIRVLDESGSVARIDETGRVAACVDVGGLDGPEWFTTNDLGWLDADGFLWLLGRADDVINRGGFKVNPLEVEVALKSHPSVRDAAVVGLPHARLGEVPAAAVTLEPGVPFSAEALRSWAAERVSHYMVPAVVVEIESLPLNSMLKLDRNALRTRLSSAT